MTSQIDNLWSDVGTETRQYLALPATHFPIALSNFDENFSLTLLKWGFFSLIRLDTDSN